MPVLFLSELASIIQFVCISLFICVLRSVYWVTKPPGMQASIFGPVLSQDKLGALCQEGHLA